MTGDFTGDALSHYFRPPFRRLDRALSLLARALLALAMTTSCGAYDRDEPSYHPFLDKDAPNAQLTSTRLLWFRWTA